MTSSLHRKPQTTIPSTFLEPINHLISSHLGLNASNRSIHRNNPNPILRIIIPLEPVSPKRRPLPHDDAQEARSEDTEKSHHAEEPTGAR